MSQETNTPVNDPNPNNEESTVGNTILLPDDNKPIEPVVPIQQDGEPDPTKPGETSVVEYTSTGDAGLDLALQFIGKQGIDEKHPAMLAAQKGDFSILKATLAASGAQGWEQFVALGEEAYKRNTEASKTKATETLGIVHKEAGGAEQWAAVQKWAAENATADERKEINALLNAGGLQAKAAARYLVSAYDKAGNVVQDPRDPTQNASGGRSGRGESDGPLSPKEYIEAVRKLNVDLRGRIDGTPQYKALQQRRAAWRPPWAI